jgi:putative flippase GtrA
VTAGHPTAFEADRTRPARDPFLARYGKFLLVGLTGVVVNLIVFTVTLDAISPRPTYDLFANLLKFASTSSSNPVDNLAASAVAFAVATLWNFALNNLWTFRSKVGHRYRLSHRLGLYYGVSLGSLAVNEVILLVASLYLAPLVGQAIGIIVGSFVGFAGNRRFTFAETNLAP